MDPADAGDAYSGTNFGLIKSREFDLCSVGNAPYRRGQGILQALAMHLIESTSNVKYRIGYKS